MKGGGEMRVKGGTKASQWGHWRLAWPYTGGCVEPLTLLHPRGSVYGGVWVTSLSHLPLPPLLLLFLLKTPSPHITFIWGFLPLPHYAFPRPPSSYTSKGPFVLSPFFFFFYFFLATKEKRNIRTKESPYTRVCTYIYTSPFL